MAVNISTVQFHQSDFVAQVQALVKNHNIIPTRLKLEITESVLLKNVERAIATMSALQEIGVRFSLDDIATDSSDKAIVCAIIAMAHSLNMDVIAEGVETEEQRLFLLEKNCTHYQGYLFGKPVPIKQFEDSLRSAREVLANVQ